MKELIVMDNLEQSINKFTQLLAGDELPDNIKQIISSLLINTKSNTDNTDSSKNFTKNTSETNDYSKDSSKNTSDEFLKILPKLKMFFDMTKQKPDNRINLLNSLKPFLSESRKQKVDNSIKYLNTFLAISALNNIDKTM
jgi:hypothetical protein